MTIAAVFAPIAIVLAVFGAAVTGPLAVVIFIIFAGLFLGDIALCVYVAVRILRGRRWGVPALALICACCDSAALRTPHWPQKVASQANQANAPSVVSAHGPSIGAFVVLLFHVVWVIDGLTLLYLLLWCISMRSAAERGTPDAPVV